MVQRRSPRGSAMGASLTRVDSEHEIPTGFLDEEDRRMFRGLDRLKLIEAAQTLRDFGFDLGEPGVVKKLIRTVWEQSEADRRADGTVMTYGEYFHTVIRAKSAALQDQSQVYYADMGEHIKIGYTVNLVSRCSSLRIDRQDVLATEPGGRELEQMRHKQFASVRIGRRENFQKSSELLSHIDMLVNHFGAPRMTSYVRLNEVA